MTEFAFDIKLNAAVRVDAPDELTARKILSECLDCADSNFGSWPDGEPILAEASLYSIVNLYEVDGEATPPEPQLADGEATADAINCQCANCNWQGPIEKVDECRDFWSRVAPGDTVPAGDCPECGAFVFIEEHETEPVSPQLLNLLKSVASQEPMPDSEFWDADEETCHQALRDRLDDAETAREILETLCKPDPVQIAAPDMLKDLKEIQTRLAEHGDYVDTIRAAHQMAGAAIAAAEGRTNV